MKRKVHQKNPQLFPACSTIPDQRHESSRSPESQHAELFNEPPNLSAIEYQTEPDSTHTNLQQLFLRQVLELYHFSSSIYVTLNAKGKIEKANLPFSDLVEVRLNHLPRYNFSHMVSPIDRARFSVFLGEVIKYGQIKTGQFRLQKKDGKILPVQMEGGTFHDYFAAPDHHSFLIRVLPTQSQYTTEEHTPQPTAGEVSLVSQEDQSDYPLRLKQITRKLILSEHNQRRQFAAQLHDFLGPRLTLCGFKVNQLQQHLKSHSSHLASEVLALLDDALAYTRMLITDLHCPILADLGLCEGLRWLADRMRDFDLHVALKVPKRPIKLPEGVDVLIFEAVRELLMNVRKHAKIHNALVSVKVTNTGSITVVVSDKGVGTDVGLLWKNPQHEHCFGLSTIRERLFAFQGALSLKSKPGQGMVATISIPNILE